MLAVAAFVYRWGMMPTDGLWFDDSWVAAGAVFGDPSALFTVGSSHPGLTAVLMVIDRLGGGFRALTLPALLAGIAGPPLAYLLCRAAGHLRSVAVVVAAVLVVAPIPLLYAGRVKGYTLDLALVAVLALAVPLLARRRWSVAGAAGWVVAAWVATTVSGFGLVAAAGAGIILFLHPQDDRWVRAGAVAVQAVGQAAYLWTARQQTDMDQIEEVLHDVYDAHLKFDPNPFVFGREVLKHLGRIAEVYPGGPEPLLGAVAVVALGGLVLASVSGRSRQESLTARYLLLLVAMAFVGGVLDRFPFGPLNDSTLSPGGRHGLWLVPAFVFGLAVVLQRLRDLAPRGTPGRGADVVLLVVAAVVLVGSHTPAPAYLFGGSASAARFVDAELGPDDRLVVTLTSTYSHALSTRMPVTLEDSPDAMVGFGPVFHDDRVVVRGSYVPDPPTDEELGEHVRGAETVLVVGSGPVAFGTMQQDGRVLTAAGFERVDVHRFEWATVEEWRPTAGPPPP